MVEYSTVIRTALTGNYDLNDITLKIDQFYAENKLTEEERVELLKLAQTNAKPENSYVSLEARVKALEEWRKSITSTSDSSGNDISDFVQPTSAADTYSIGDKVRFNGVIYESLINDNVWSPGVYPQGWKTVEMA